MKKGSSWITDSLRLSAFASTGYTVEEIAEKLNMDVHNVICRVKELGYPVKHRLGMDPVTISKEPASQEPEKAAKPKKSRVIGRNLPANKRKRILQLRRQGMTYQKIADEIGMSYSFVWNICHAK